MNERTRLLVEAEKLVNGDRNNQYGDPSQDFKRTAEMWSAYLGFKVEPHDVAAMMTLLKISRIRWSPGKFDSWADGAGYLACGWDVHFRANITKARAIKSATKKKKKKKKK